MGFHFDCLPDSMYELVLRDVSDRKSESGSSDTVITGFDPATSLPKTYKIEAVSASGQIHLKEDHTYRVAVRAVVIVCVEQKVSK